MWKPELKWHQMTICWYVLGNQKGQIFQWWRICLISYMVCVRLYFWVLFRLANQCKFWLEVWRKDSVVSQTFLESGSNDCRYVDMPTHLVGIWKIESFGSNHLIMGIQRWDKHLRLMRMWWCLHLYTRTWSIMVYLWHFLCFEVHSFHPSVAERNIRYSFGSRISLYFIGTCSTHDRCCKWERTHRSDMF